ncbi:MAG: hypothetical protein H6Q67_2178 [Firmicutes bacterium]|nr:hypothetical protein [Bacillota bacterium]
MIVEEKKRGGAREGAGRKTGPGGIKKPHAIRFTDATWARIVQNAKTEGFDTVTAFIEDKTAY